MSTYGTLSYEFATQSSHIFLQGSPVTTETGSLVELYHYSANTRTRQGPTSSEETVVSSEEQLYRGVIFITSPEQLALEPEERGERRQISFFPHTEEITEEDKISDLIGSANSYSIYKANEASCLLRVFKVDEMWFVTTHHRLNAGKSHWGCDKSFLEQFEDAIFYLYTKHCGETTDTPEHDQFWSNFPADLTGSVITELFLGTLDGTKGYTFLVCPTTENKNRFVSPGCDHPTVVNSGVFTYDTTDSEPTRETVFGNATLHHNESVLGIPSPESVSMSDIIFDDSESFATNLHRYTNNLDSFDQGVMVFTPTNHFKLVNEKYHYKRELRGNHNILFRYIDLALNYSKDENGAQMFDDYKELYPEHNDVFINCEQSLCQIISVIGTAYYKQHDPKIRDTRRVFPSEYKLMYSMHKWHLEEVFDKKGRRANKVFLPGTMKSLRFNGDFEYNEEHDIFINVKSIWDRIYELSTIFVYKMVNRCQTYKDTWTIYDIKQVRTVTKKRHPFSTKRMVTNSSQPSTESGKQSTSDVSENSN